MKDDIFSVFAKIHAEDALKEKTRNYLYKEIQKKRRVMKGRSGLVVACSVLAGLFFGGAGFYTVYLTPSAYIDVDINPSIELTLNRFGKVIRSNAYNDDGTDLLKEVSVQNESYGEAIRELMDAMELAGYFEQDSLLSVTVQAKGSSRESSILDGLKESIDICNGEHHHNAVADIAAVTEEVKKQAKQEQLSPAKYLAIQELIEANQDISMEECRGHSVGELRERLGECCNGEEEHEEYNTGHHGSHSCH